MTEENVRNRFADVTYSESEKNAEDSPQGKKDKPQSKLLGKIMLCVLTGIIFGIVTEKGRVFEPRAIRYQMVFNKMIMLKMFLSAMATGMFGLAVLAMLPYTSSKFYRACTTYYNDLTEKGVIACVLGGTLLGIGMTLSGSCPTMIFTQIGAMVPNVEYTFAGALLGTLLYGILKPFIDKFTKSQISESSNPWENSPYFILAMPIAVMFGMIVLSFEILYPWTRDVKNTGDVESVFDLLHVKAWPPFISGMVVGSLQIPLVLGLGETLGGSSSFITMLAQVMVGPLKKLSPFISKYKYGFDHWWQIFYICGAILGAYLSASSSGYLGKSVGVPSTYAFIGGSLLTLGARIAGGCTSGHGLSGMSFLSILSVITVACMFAGAIGTGVIMKYMGLLKI